MKTSDLAASERESGLPARSPRSRRRWPPPVSGTPRPPSGRGGRMVESNCGAGAGLLWDAPGAAWRRRARLAVVPVARSATAMQGGLAAEHGFRLACGWRRGRRRAGAGRRRGCRGRFTADVGDDAGRAAGWHAPGGRSGGRQRPRSGREPTPGWRWLDVVGKRCAVSE